MLRHPVCRRDSRRPDADKSTTTYHQRSVCGTEYEYHNGRIIPLPGKDILSPFVL